MREIVLDTETTGLDPLAGHRVVEVGCIELVNTVATGRTFHAYFNPADAHADGRAGRSRAERRVPVRQAAVRRQGRGVPGVRRRRPAGDPQRAVRHRLPQCRARARRQGRSSPTPMSTPFGRAPQVPRPARQPRRALRALRHRQLEPHQARRAARFGAAGRGLSRAERRPSARSRPGGRDGGRVGICHGRQQSAGAPAAAACAEPEAELAAHVAFLARSRSRSGSRSRWLQPTRFRRPAASCRAGRAARGAASRPWRPAACRCRWHRGSPTPIRPSHDRRHRS